MVDSHGTTTRKRENFKFPSLVSIRDKYRNKQPYIQAQNINFNQRLTLVAGPLTEGKLLLLLLAVWILPVDLTARIRAGEVIFHPPLLNFKKNKPLTFFTDAKRSGKARVVSDCNKDIPLDKLMVAIDYNKNQEEPTDYNQK